MKQLLKLLLGAGLILVDSGHREKVAESIHDRADDWAEKAKDKYQDAVDRVERVSYAIRGKEPWTSKAGSFLLGLGVGVGMGMLFAPAPGAETRNTIAQQASNFRDRVSEQASNIRDRVSEQASNLKERVRDSVSREGGAGGPEGSERLPRTA